MAKQLTLRKKQQIKPEEESDFTNREIKLLKELLIEKTEQMQQIIKDQAKEFYETKAEIQKREEAWQLEKGLLIKDLTDTLKIINQLKVEQVRLEEQKNEEIRRLKE